MTKDEVLKLAKECGAEVFDDEGYSNFDTIFKPEKLIDFANAIEQKAMEAQQWFGVDERLPDGKCIATYLNEAGNKRTIVARYFKRYTVESRGDDECACEYSEADDCFYVEEGWYECIDNWDDYTSVKVYQGKITHWMPLPATPDAIRANKE